MLIKITFRYKLILLIMIYKYFKNNDITLIMYLDIFVNMHALKFFLFQTLLLSKVKKHYLSLLILCNFIKKCFFF